MRKEDVEQMHDCCHTHAAKSAGSVFLCSPTWFYRVPLIQRSEDSHRAEQMQGLLFFHSYPCRAALHSEHVQQKRKIINHCDRSSQKKIQTVVESDLTKTRRTDLGNLSNQPYVSLTEQYLLHLILK